MLILDQPYTGLDKNSRAHLNQLLNKYAGKGGTLIIISNDTELPDCITHSATLTNGKLLPGNTAITQEEKKLLPLPSFLKEKPSYSSHSIISMKKIYVRYDEKYVLTDVSWQVNAGEKWLLQGHNGSGKSTLLSLITADHPQAYANDIKLFGIQRGGNIWDIKKRIGLISLGTACFLMCYINQSCASGFFDAS